MLVKRAWLCAKTYFGRPDGKVPINTFFLYNLYIADGFHQQNLKYISILQNITIFNFPVNENISYHCNSPTVPGSSICSFTAFCSSYSDNFGAFKVEMSKLQAWWIYFFVLSQLRVYYLEPAAKWYPFVCVASHKTVAEQVTVTCCTP